MTPSQQALLLSLNEEMNISKTSLRRYMNEDKYPAYICVLAERLSNGVLKASMMDAMTFTPTADQRLLAANIKSLYLSNTPIEPQTESVVIMCLNYLEAQQPHLYNDLAESILESNDGLGLITLRKAHRQHASD